jgi:hypothetical protein
LVVSSEKNDMSRRKNDIPRPGHLRIVQPDTEPDEPGSPLRCVWTSHPDHELGCHSHIPTRAVADAWWRELALGRAQAGFFHFAWREDVWLAYGLPNGHVRGVYCPVHRAEREERLGYDPELVLDIAHDSDSGIHDSGPGVYAQAVSSAALADAP